MMKLGLRAHVLAAKPRSHGSQQSGFYWLICVMDVYMHVCVSVSVCMWRLKLGIECLP